MRKIVVISLLIGMVALGTVLAIGGMNRTAQDRPFLKGQSTEMEAYRTSVKGEEECDCDDCGGDSLVEITGVVGELTEEMKSVLTVETIEGKVFYVNCGPMWLYPDLSLFEDGTEVTVTGKIHDDNEISVISAHVVKIGDQTFVLRDESGKKITELFERRTEIRMEAQNSKSEQRLEQLRNSLERPLRRFGR
jgi:uncharacterized protein YdeI (BOF family)